MKNRTDFLKGCVRVRIQGGQTERFLNLCKAGNISICGIERENEQSLTGYFRIRDFFRLSSIHRKTKVKIHILEKHGLPFFFYRCKKRKAFFLGAFLCISLLFFLSGRLWEINVTGNIRNTTPEIRKFLKEQGIVHGMARKKISCSEIVSWLRENYSDITWASARLEGTKLFLTIKEGIFVENEEAIQREACNLVADSGGEIVKMITRAGVPQKKVGDLCEKGEILVTGILELKNDSQEVVKYEAVHADADVYIKRQKAYYHEISMDYETEEFTGEEKKGGYIRIGNIYLGMQDQSKKDFDQMTEEKAIYLTRSFRLPVSIGNIRCRQYQTVKKEYTVEEVRELAWQALQLYEEKLMQKGVQISANNVKIEVDHKTCISKGFLEIIEKIGEETPVEIPEQPAERTTEDG